MSDVTALIPFKRGGNETWLKQAIGSLPLGTPYLLLENDGELAGALNVGVEAAKTDWVLRLDADDVLSKDALQFLHALTWDADVTYPSLMKTDEELRPVEMFRAAPFCPNRLKVWNYIPGCALMRREKVLAAGGYRELELLEDWDLWVRLHEQGATFKAVPEAVVNYRQHPDSRNRAAREEQDGLRERMRALIVGDEPELKATFRYQLSYATTYWRCLLPARYLPGQAIDYPNVKVEGEETDDPELSFPDQRGAAIWQFPGDGGSAVLMAAQQADGFRVLVESDDNYFDASPQRNGWGKKLGDEQTTLEAHQKIVPWTDGVIVTTEALAKRYRRFNEKVFVCPNQIDPDDWLHVKKPQDGILRIGWFASPSHRGDGRLIQRALEWASGQPDVEVLTMGYDPGWRFPRKHIPWTNDMGVYRMLLGQLDVGLAPLVETPWSVCRSDLKALEYAMAGAFPVLSEAEPYKGYTGPRMKARNARDFHHVVKSLVGFGQEAVREMAQDAREHVLKERTMDKHIWRWEEALHG